MNSSNIPYKLWTMRNNINLKYIDIYEGDKFRVNGCELICVEHTPHKNDNRLYNGDVDKNGVCLHSGDVIEAIDAFDNELDKQIICCKIFTIQQFIIPSKRMFACICNGFLQPIAHLFEENKNV